MALVLNYRVPPRDGHLSRVRDESGQTSVEWLMLMGLAFITAYLAMTTIVAGRTRQIIYTLRGSLGNVMQNGELNNGNLVTPDQRGHPSDPARLKAVH